MFGTYSVAMVTPFSETGRINWQAVEGVVEHLVNHGVEGLLISGTTGEQHSMSIDERIQLFHTVVRTVSGRAKVFAGVAATTTDGAIQLAQAAEQAGANGIMLGLPPYLRPTQEELMQYVAETSETITIPVLLYNNPPRTGSDLLASSIVTLFERGHIHAVKYVGTLEDARSVMEQTDHRLPFYTGSDLSVVDSIDHGFEGITSILGNLFPIEMREVVLAAKLGRTDQANAILDALRPAANAVFSASTPVGLKYAMRSLGIPGGFCRRPLGRLGEGQSQAVDAALRSFALK